MRWSIVLALVVPLGFVATEPTAKADALPAPRSESPAKRALVLTVDPVFGSDVAPSPGWNEVVVTVENHEAAPFVGTVENTSDRYGSQAVGIVSAAVNVPARGQAKLKLPVRLAPYGSSNFNVRLVTANGDEVARRSTTVVQHPSPTLIEWSASRRLGVEVRGNALPITGVSPSVVNRLRVGEPTFEPLSGDAILPDSPAAYVGVDVMLMTSADLAHVKGSELAALAGFVLGGGTLAIVPTRAEDLRTAPLSTFLGGDARRSSTPAELLSIRGGMRSVPSGPKGAAPLSGRGPVGTETFEDTRGADLLERLTGYTGGNLHDERFGAAASYGLGEVHLLGFDPLAQENASDPWIHARVIELVARAYNRRSLRAFPARDEERGDDGRDTIRQALDPNENFRGALGISAIVLVLYAILAGPVLHLRARKRQKPFEPLIGAPLLSAGTFVLLVVVGLAAKGFRGQARHIAFVETGAGMGRATGVSYRGFFSSRAEQLTLRSIGPQAMIARAERGEQEPDRFVKDRDGLVLQSLAALPWQTVVVRESGYLYDLTGSVDVRRMPDGHLKIRNHLKSALRDVVVGDGARGTYFATVAAGATVMDSDGRALPPRYRDTTSYTSTPIHRLTSYLLRDAIQGPEGMRVAATWEMAEALAQGSDFWSDSTPVLLAEIELPKAKGTDSGLRLESERVLLRVLGEGGTP